MLVQADAIDPDGDAMLTATTLPAGATFTYLTGTTSSGFVKWQPQAAGTYQLGFSASDVTGATINKEITITITENSEKGVWTKVSLPEDPQIIKVLAQNQTIYAVTRLKSSNFTNAIDLLLRSVDNGQSWTKVGDGLPADALLFDFVGNAEGSLYASTSAGLYRSRDSGENWSLIGVGKGLPDDGKNIFYLAASGDKVLAAGGTSQKAFLSLDRGQNWADVTPNLLATNNLSIAAVGISGNTLLIGVGVVFSQTASIAYYSTDNGASWQGANNGDQFAQPIYRFVGGATDLYGLTTTFIYRSQDRGQNWTLADPLDENRPSNLLFNAAFAVNGNLFMVAFQDYGIYLSRDDGKTFLPINQGLPDLQIKNLLIQRDVLFALNESGRLYRMPRSQ